MTKNKPVKARIGYTSDHGLRVASGTMAFTLVGPNEHCPHPIAVLDISDPDALVEQLSEAIVHSHYNESAKLSDFCLDNIFRKDARAALSSLGLLRPSKRNRKGKGSA